MWVNGVYWLGSLLLLRRDLSKVFCNSINWDFSVIVTQHILQPIRNKTGIDLILKSIKASITEVKEQDTILVADGNQKGCLMCEKMLGCVLEPHGSLCKCVLFCLIGLLIFFKVNIWQSTFSN